MTTQFNRDSRAVAFTTEYALLALVALGLLAVVPTGFASVADSTQEDVAQAEFDRIAAEVAASIDAADQQYEQHHTTVTQTGISADPPQIEVRPEVPESVGETNFFIRIKAGQVIVEPAGINGPDARGTAPLQTNLSVTANGGTSGGAVIVEVDATKSTIIVRSDGVGGEVPTEVSADA